MKKIIIIALAALIMCAVCAQAETLVVWFSCTGNTEAAARTAAEALGADMRQIVPEVPYTDADLDYNDSTSRACLEQKDHECRPAIAGETDIAPYDTIIIAYPVWWGEEPRIIDTWMESVDLSGKRVAAICTSGSSGIDDSYMRLQDIAPDAQWLGAARFNAEVSLSDMEDWCALTGIEKRGETIMLITVGEYVLPVRMADNESADALTALLSNGPVTIPASNYGGFEKVCPLGKRLPSSDEYTVTQPGDVMLYAGSNIVIFHGSNGWEYTRLGKIEGSYDLAAILGGSEKEITLSLE